MHRKLMAALVAVVVLVLGGFTAGTASAQEEGPGAYTEVPAEGVVVETPAPQQREIQVIQGDSQVGTNVDNGQFLLGVVTVLGVGYFYLNRNNKRRGQNRALHAAFNWTSKAYNTPAGTSAIVTVVFALCWVTGALKPGRFTIGWAAGLLMITVACVVIGESQANADGKTWANRINGTWGLSPKEAREVQAARRKAAADARRRANEAAAEIRALEEAYEEDYEPTAAYIAPSEPALPAEAKDPAPGRTVFEATGTHPVTRTDDDGNRWILADAAASKPPAAEPEPVKARTLDELPGPQREEFVVDEHDHADEVLGLKPADDAATAYLILSSAEVEMELHSPVGITKLDKSACVAGLQALVHGSSDGLKAPNVQQTYLMLSAADAKVVLTSEWGPQEAPKELYLQGLKALSV